MQKIICTIGLPASGKSTWAYEYSIANPDFIVINKDTIRERICKELNTAWNKKIEKMVEDDRDRRIYNYLKLGLSIISDDTNFSQRHIHRIREIAVSALGEGNFEFEVNSSFLNISVNECIARDARREKPVGSKVIIDMWRRYIQPEPKEWQENEMETAVIVDLDGTLALFGKKNSYDRDFENDTINWPLVNILSGLKNQGIQIIFVSGRQERFREPTLDFLRLTGLIDDNWMLFMRATDDNRNDAIIKNEIYENYIEGQYNIMCAFDDRKRVKRMWVEKGIMVFDLNQYDLEF